MYPFNNYNPCSEQSDRRSPVGMRVSGAWSEQETQIKHFIKTQELTGEQWHCIVDPKGNLIAEYTLGRTYQRVTLIKRRANGHELSREMFGLRQGTTIPPRTTYNDLKSYIEAGLKSETVVLVSGSGEPVEDDDGNLTVESWEYIHGEHGESLGKKGTAETHSKDGTLISHTVGDQRTAYAAGPISAPLDTQDLRTGSRTHIMDGDLIVSSAANQQLEEKIPIVRQAKVTSTWKRLISRLSGRSSD